MCLNFALIPWRVTELIVASMRQASAYRDYSDNNAHILRFIRKDCDLGF